MSISNTEILRIIDKAFPYMPEGKSFLFTKALKNAGIVEIDIKDKNAVNAIRSYFVEKLLYARYDSVNFEYIRLDGIGPIVKNAGGHFAYLEQREKKFLAEQKVKEMEIAKFTADYETSLFQATEGIKLQKRSFTRSGWAIGISIAAVIISVAAILVTHNDTKQDLFPYDTSAANAKLQQLEQRLDSLDSKAKSLEPFELTPGQQVKWDTVKRPHHARQTK